MKGITAKGTFKNPANILVDLPHGLGDIIMCFPLFASIKAKFPESRITVLSPNKASKLLLKYNSHIDHTIIFKIDFTVKGLIRHLLKNIFILRKECREHCFDTYINIHPNIIRSFNMHFCGIENTISNTLNIHKTLECRNILGFMGIPVKYDYALNAESSKAVLSKFKLKSKKYILLDYYPQHLDADPRKWDSFDRLAELLNKKGFITAAAGMNRNHSFCAAKTDLVNKTDFDELIHLIADASAVVSMDTGFFHLSYALDTPVIGLFGPVNPDDRKPFNKNLSVKTIYNNPGCSPCIKNKVAIPCIRKEDPYRCMRSISPETVLREIEKIIIKKAGMKKV